MANDETTPKWITTRTQADIDNDTELAYITYTDLNRIGERINELMIMADYSSAPCKTDWEKITSQNSENNFPTQNIIFYMLRSINLLCKDYGIDFEIYKNKENRLGKYLTIYHMNYIEETLHNLYLKLTDAQNSST